MAKRQDEVLESLKRIEEKLDRLLECFALPKLELVRKEEIDSREEKPDRLSELLDAFEKLSPEERRRDIERTNEFLRQRMAEQPGVPFLELDLSERPENQGAS